MGERRQPSSIGPSLDKASPSPYTLRLREAFSFPVRPYSVSGSTLQYGVLSMRFPWVEQQFGRRHFGWLAAGSAATAWSVTSLAQDPKPQDDKTPAPKLEDPKPAETPKPTGPVEALFERDYDPPSFKPSWRKEQINRTLAQDFVIFAHSDLEMTSKLLDREPGLIHAAIDWGGGDYETALGGASHMGRHDIVQLLLGRGARIDLFCAAMLGQIDAIRAFLTLEPNLINAKGPHGFSLHFHAQVGGEKAQETLDYLQSIQHVELKPIPFLNKK